jgi:hypothetical protein
MGEGSNQCWIPCPCDVGMEPLLSLISTLYILVTVHSNLIMLTYAVPDDSNKHFFCALVQLQRPLRGHQATHRPRRSVAHSLLLALESTAMSAPLLQWCIMFFPSDSLSAHAYVAFTSCSWIRRRAFRQQQRVWSGWRNLPVPFYSDGVHVQYRRRRRLPFGARDRNLSSNAHCQVRGPLLHSQRLCTVVCFSHAARAY